jgi:hypothetical protein
MEQQLLRMHQENQSLRDGDGLHRELAATVAQLREALDTKALLSRAMHGRIRMAQVGVWVGDAGGAGASGEEARWRS